MKHLAIRLVALCAAATLATAAQGADAVRNIAETQPSAAIARKSYRAAGGVFGEYWWANRFLDKYNEVAALKGKTVDLVMIGDSITHNWESLFTDSWAAFIKGRAVLNLGFGSDATQNVIWRLKHGELDGYTAKAVSLMIGTNNNGNEKSDPANVAEGVKAIVALIREKQPEAKILLHAIFPRGCSPESPDAPKRRRNDATNKILADFAKEDGNIVWIDLTKELTGKDGWVPRSLLHKDETHPNAVGYVIWRKALEPYLK